MVFIYFSPKKNPLDFLKNRSWKEHLSFKKIKFSIQMTDVTENLMALYEMLQMNRQ